MFGKLMREQQSRNTYEQRMAWLLDIAGSADAVQRTSVNQASTVSVPEGENLGLPNSMLAGCLIRCFPAPQQPAGGFILRHDGPPTASVRRRCCRLRRSTNCPNAKLQGGRFPNQFSVIGLYPSFASPLCLLCADSQYQTEIPTTPRLSTTRPKKPCPRSLDTKMRITSLAPAHAYRLLLFHR